MTSLTNRRPPATTPTPVRTRSTRLPDPRFDTGMGMPSAFNTAHGGTGRTSASYDIVALALLHGSPPPPEARPCLERPRALPSWTSTADMAKATRLLAERRRRSDGFKNPSKQLKNKLKSKEERRRLDQAENWEFSPEERMVLVTENVSESGEIGVAQALVELKGDNLMNEVGELRSPTIKLAKRSSKDGAGASLEPDEWIVVATEHASISHVSLFASRGSRLESLNRALSIAFALRTREGVVIVEELIKYGADPNYYHEQVLAAVDENRLEIVEACLRSSNKLQPVYLNSALANAIQKRLYDMVARLLAYSADPNYQGAQGFLDSVRAFDPKMTLLLLYGSKEPVRLRPEYLDHALSIVIERSDRRRIHETVNLLLCAGASPTSRLVEEELLRATREGDVQLIHILVAYGTSVNHDDARVIRAALESEDLTILDILLGGNASATALSKAIPQAMRIRGREQRLKAMKALLARNVSGSELDRALVEAIQQEDSKLFTELRNCGGVNANYGDGIPLEMALKARNPAYLQALCDRANFEFSTASRIVPIAQDPSNYQESRTQAIIGASKGHTTVLDKSLIDEISLFGSRETVIKMLLDNGASVDFNKGAALYQAALAGDTNAVRILTTGATPLLSGLCSAFRAAMSLQEASVRLATMKALLEAAGKEKIGQDEALIQESGTAVFNGTSMVEMLLSYGASVDHSESAAIQAALSSQSAETLRLLLTASPTAPSLNIALAESMKLEPILRKECATLIIAAAEKTKSHINISHPLEVAIAQEDKNLLDLLLRYGGDTSLEDGEAFIEAAKLNDTKIFETILAYRPNIQKLLPALIRSLQDEDKLVRVLSLCFERLQIQFNPKENVLLFLAIDQFQQGHKLVKFLLEAGCSPGAVRQLQLREGSDVEAVTPLIWALSRPLPGASKSVLLTLLDRGAEARPDFVTPISRTTALLEAAKTARFAILSRLIEVGAKVNVEDSSGRSALLLASESGDVEFVKALLNARVRPNDGSLHAAARGAHEDIVRLLLNKGHTPNYIHARRSALAELCLNGHPEGEDWTNQVYWVIDTLINEGTNLETEYNGKNLLHLALDNDMPVPIVTILLQFPYFSEHLNHSRMLYEDPSGTVYSPLSYAETFYNGPTSEKSKLITILADKNCAPNLWNRQGKHPPNYTYKTMPTYLKQLVDEDKLADQRHARELARRKEAAKIEQEIAETQGKLRIQQASELHRSLLLEQQQRDAAQTAAEQRRHELAVQYTQQLTAAEASGLHTKHTIEINHAAALATQRQQIEDRDRTRQYQHQAQLGQLEEQKVKALGFEQERTHKRQLQLLAVQDESVRMRAREMKEVAAVAAANHTPIAGPGQQRMLDWATVD